MTATSYNDISTANSVKLLNTFSEYNEYIMLFTEIDSHIEKGDRVYITVVSDNGELSENSIILDNLYSSNIDTLYNDTLQGYNVIFVDKTKNAIVINKKVSDITSTDDISGYTIENQYISKISIHNIIVDKCTINGATIKYGIINNTKNDGDVNWIQGNIFGGEIYNTTLDNKYDNSYITLKKFESMSYVFTANNTEIGLNDGYSYFYNVIIQDSIITNGNFIDCDLQNTEDYFIDGGYFNGCNYVGYHINNGYHKNIIDLDIKSCVWNNGYFDCPETGYSFKLDYWNNGTFVNGLFGGVDGQKCYKPIWKNGIFNNGIFDSYRWENGEFNNGIFGANGKIGNKTTSTYNAYEAHFGITKRRADGNLLNSTLQDNIYEYPVFVNGIINGGFFIRTKFLNATVGNGTIADSTILNIKNLGGLLIDCSIKTGELSGGFVRSNNLSFVINDCTISDTDINIYNKEEIQLNKYKNDSSIVKDYINAYSEYNRNDTFIFINNCSLISPKCKISKENTNRVFINKQQNIKGGEYENINLNFPQIIDGGNFKNTNISYTDKVANSVFCSVRPVRVLTDDNGTSNTVYTMFEYDNNGQIPFININVTATPTTAMNLYGYIYTKLANNGTGNIDIFDTFKINVLNNSNNYDPRKYNDITTKYENISPTGDTYVILDLEYDDYMFGDFGLLYLSTNGNINSNDKYIINGGKFEKCELNGITNSRMSIYGGVFDNTNLNGFINIYSCDFNGGKIIGNSNVWNGGNFNSGTFGDDSSTDVIYELKIISGSHTYVIQSGETQTLETLTNVMKLVDIYPLIIRREYTKYNNFDSIGKLHDDEYQEYYLDIWNETGIDFTGTSSGIANEDPWSDNITNSDNYLIIPSHFVFVINHEDVIKMKNTLSFIQKHIDIEIYDVGLGESFNSFYNKYYEKDKTFIPVNDFRSEFINYYINDRTYSIAFVFKFNKIEELFNNTLNKNQQWFDNIFKDYSLYYKNIWSEANAEYFVRPMPIFNKQTSKAETIFVNVTGDYGSYPIPTYSKFKQNTHLPAPWDFDNDGKLWLPIHKEYARHDYNNYKNSIINYSKKYFKNTSEILPFEYYNFRKNTKSPFNTALPLSKYNKNDYITDSIEINSNINNYVPNINSIGNKQLLNVDTWLYKGGWEKYVDVPFNFKITTIENLELSWIYVDQNYGINLSSLYDAKFSNNKFLHVVSHNERFINDYDGACRILFYNNVMNNPNLYKIQIDKKITNNYGHAFIVESNNFIFDNVSKTIKILNFGTNNYSIKAGSYLYIYTPSYRRKVTIAVDGIMKPNNEMWIVISDNITINSQSSLNFVYGLDYWSINTSNPQTGVPKVSRIDINLSNNRYQDGFSGTIIPSNEIYNKWVAGDPLFIYSQEINTIYSPVIKSKYPNDYVQGKIINIYSIKENYDGMYLYDSIFDYSKDKEANKVNVYLYDNINIPHYNKVWIKDSTTINIIGNSIDFNDGLTLLNSNNYLYGNVIRYKNMCSFKKTTNIFKINADISDTNYINAISQIENNSDYVEIHDSSVSILSGKFERKYGNNNILIESYSKKYFSALPFVGFSTFVLRTLPIYYDVNSSGVILKKDVGNCIEFGKSLSNSMLSSAFVIRTDDIDTVVTIRYDNRDTTFGKILNVDRYKNKDIAIIAKIDYDYVYYRANIITTKQIDTNIFDVDVILNRDINEMKKVEFGFFYIIEEMTEGPCYKYYTTNETGIEITENDIYHYNNGDPTKLIQNSPKAILMNINERVRTSEEIFERQAGLKISSKYDINSGEDAFSDDFKDGNFYSGVFYGNWYDGDWFAGSTSFKGDNYYNKQAGLDFTKAPERKESTIKNFTEIINSLIKRGEYFMYPPWSSKERQIIVTPKISRSDEY